MARIFTIYFLYNGAEYSAIISVRTTAFFTEYILGGLDEALMQQLPGDKILSQIDGEFFFQYTKAHHPEALMKAILGSVAAHLYPMRQVRNA